MENIECTVKFEFEKVPFVPTLGNSGRCLKCDAREYCGANFKCPCEMDEQLVIVKSKILK